MKKQNIVLVWSAIVLFIIIAGFVALYMIDANSDGFKSKETEVFSCVSTDIKEYKELIKHKVLFFGKNTVERQRKWTHCHQENWAEGGSIHVT